MMNLYERYPELEVCRADIEKAADMIYETYQKKVAWGIYSGIEKYLQSDPL